MNILLTCAGRRSYLVDYFKEALDGKGKVYAANSTPDTSAMLAADGAFVVPPLYVDGYIDYLKGICLEYDIKLIVPLFDLELPILAAHKNEFNALGVKIAVSDSDVVATCNDKIKTAAFVRSLGFKTLYTTTDLEKARMQIIQKEISFPLYIKPRWGMGSIAVQQAETMEELIVLFQKSQTHIRRSYLRFYPNIELDQSVIIQEAAKGIEYGLDVVNDLEGRYQTTFVRQKLEMRSGETDSAITEFVPDLLQLGEIIGKKLGHIGNLDMDVFWDNQNATILEINARFGGGYPFSHLAGANLPKAYLDWTANKTTSEANLNIDYGVKGIKTLYIMNANKAKIAQ